LVINRNARGEFGADSGGHTADSGHLAITSPRHGRARPGHPRLLPPRARKQDVDARDTSAFTRVFDALSAGMTTERQTQLERKSL
jgi:hypothetical protein